MKRVFLIILAACGLVQAQNNPNVGPANLAGLLYASNFAQWTVPQGDQGAYTWSNSDICKVHSAGATFYAFTANVPVQIIDTGNPAHNETVTPSIVDIGTSGCSISVHPTYVHNSFYFQSASAGLNEALVFAGQQTYQIVLTPDWTRLGGITSNITSATGNTNVSILDQRTADLAYYTWNGSAYAAGAFGAVSSLTTTGSSGAATLISGVLNVPQYSGGSTAFSSLTGGTNTTAAMLVGTGASLSASGLGTLGGIIYTSCGSDLGAQINTAVTALGAAGGLIMLPNCTTATMTTTATNIPPQISITGYGKNATIINCSVAGDCLQFLMNPVTHGEIGAVIQNFQMVSTNGASNQVLLHANGMGGYVLHDLQFQPFNVTSNTAVCLEFDNTSGSGTFTEGNTTWNIDLERACAPGVLFNGESAGSSFGYNTFQFKGASTGANYVVQFNGTGYLYNSTIQLMCNHIATGAGGGCMQFNNAFSTSSVNNGTTNLFISAEEDGTGTGTVLSATGTNNLGFVGQINNGAAGGQALTNTAAIAGGATYNLYSPSGSTGITTTGFTQAMVTDVNNGTLSGTIVRSLLCPNINTTNGSCGLVVGHDTGNSNEALLSFNYFGNASTSNRINLSMFGDYGVSVDTTGAFYVGNGSSANLNMVGADTWTMGVNSSGQWFPYDSTHNTTPFAITTAATTYANLLAANSNAVWGWSSNSQYANNAVPDTGLSRGAAGTVDCGNGTQGSVTCFLNVGKINVLAARKGTFTCTNGGTITISNTNGLATSDIIITMNTAGGTITTPPAFKTITAGTGFTVLCGATDTSVYNYDILN